MKNRLIEFDRERLARDVARRNSRFIRDEDDDHSIRMPALTCPECGYVTDAATQVDHEEPRIPKGGDVSICIKCAAVSIFIAPGSLRAPSAGELAEINGNRVINSAVRAIREIQRRRAEEDGCV